MMAWIRSAERVMEGARIKERASRAAAGLRSLGVKPGDVMAVLMRNDFAYFEASLAANKVGACFTPNNWGSSPDEIAYILKNSNARVVVVHSDLHHLVERAIPRNVIVFLVETPAEIVSAYGLSPDAVRPPGGALLWNDWLEGFTPESDAVPAAGTGALIYTSGVTGRPKGVRRKPFNREELTVVRGLVDTVFGLEGWRDHPEDIVTVIVGSMYQSTVNGWAIVFFSVGANIILMPRFDPEKLLRIIQQYKVTHLFGGPSTFIRLLKLPVSVKKKYYTSSLRFVTHGVAPCPSHVKQAMILWWGPIISEHYGATETGAVTFCTSEEWLSHPGTVGRPLPNAQVLVLDENGHAVEKGGTGEIYSRLQGFPDFTYEGETEKRRRVEKRRLISLGDVGYFDKDGYLFLCDRATDVVNINGIKIFPIEVEAELHKMPGIVDCAVFGVPDEQYGETLCAVVQMQPGTTLSLQDVRTFLHGRVADFKIPRRIEFHKALPREDTGKIFKRKLRDPFWKEAHRRI
jgi:long-chain acyl-CoA synthetase